MSSEKPGLKFEGVMAKVRFSVEAVMHDNSLEIVREHNKFWKRSYATRIAVNRESRIRWELLQRF